ncbi:MAG TPA: hypothetical protein VIW64_06790 [Pyrinomonadaceae bacterium]
MPHKLFISTLTLILLCASASPQRRPAPATPKPQAARLLVQGTYEETFTGTTTDGNAQGKLVIKFEAARWLNMKTNEVGNAEFSELANAPAASVSGLASYDGRVKGSSGGDSYEASSSFTGPLSADDVVLSVPEYTDTGNGFKIKVFINPKLKGKCSLLAVRGDQTSTSTDCRNGTFFFSASTPLDTDDNDDPAHTADNASLASFGIELDIEPAAGPSATSVAGSPVDQAGRARRELEATLGQGPAGDAGVYAWRGAVTNGSKDAGFKIVLDQTKELPSADRLGRSTRRLIFNATIIPGVPK